MAFPRTKTKRVLRSDPARCSAEATADDTQDDDQERNATSARSSPTRSIRYRRRSRSAAPAAAMAVVWHCDVAVASRLGLAAMTWWCSGLRGSGLRLGFGREAEESCAARVEGRRGGSERAAAAANSLDGVRWRWVYIGQFWSLFSWTFLSNTFIGLFILF